MIMKPGPIVRALESIDRVDGPSFVVLLTPQGQTFEQSMAWELSRADQLVLICCRYEGVDERVRSDQIHMEVSVGDYILSGGYKKYPTYQTWRREFRKETSPSG